jgi:hypothetical protein
MNLNLAFPNVDVRQASAFPLDGDRSVLVDAPHLTALTDPSEKVLHLSRDECHAGSHLAAQGEPDLQNTGALGAQSRFTRNLGPKRRARSRTRMLFTTFHERDFRVFHCVL